VSRPNAGTHRRKATLAAIGLSGIAAFAAAPAHAAVAPGHNLLTVHNLDFIAATGYDAGDPLTISVERPGAGTIASVTAPAVETADGVGLELNHGPVGAPVPGDCWEGAVPDVLPGDTISVAYTGGEDTVVVDDIDILRAPYLIGNDVAVEGVARTAAGAPIPVEELNSGEVRNPASDVRATATRVERIAGTTDRWRALYERGAAAQYGVFRNGGGLGLNALRDAILAGDHAMGYGHVEPLPPVAQLVDGIGGGGAAPGCPADRFERNSIEGADRQVINVANAGTPLVVNGLAASDVTAAEDVAITIDGESVPATVTLPTAGTWRATIAPGAIPAADGTVTIQADFPNSSHDTIDGARITTLVLPKDTVAPAAPTADMEAREYVGSITVKLSGEAGATIRYTNDGTAPTASSPVAPASIPVTATQTLRAIAVDAAGNPSPVATLAYVITQPAATGGGTTGGGTGGGTTVTTATTTGAGTVLVPLTLGNLSVNKTMRRATVRRSGVRLVMRLKDGTTALRIRVHRKKRNGTKSLLATGTRATSRAGLYRTVLKDPRLRRDLTPGSYEVEVTPGRSLSSLGTPARYAFKVRR
jgi:hypothetical protein